MTILDRLHAAVEDGDGVVGNSLVRLSYLRRSPVPVKAVVPAPVQLLARSVKPLVSVIIPCYNYGHFLAGSIESVLRQRGVDVEVIVVNDASTDDTAGVADKFAAADGRVTVLHNSRNTGHVVAFNCGFSVARGEFIARLDADDLLTDGSLARAVALFDAYPSVGLVYGHPRHFSSASPPAGHIADVSWTVWAGPDWLAERCRRTHNCISTPEAVVRGDVVREIGSLNTDLQFAQDMEMWLRMSAVSDVGRVNGADQAFHREHPASMSVTAGAGGKTDLTERLRVFDLLFASIGERIRNAQELRAMAMRSLAEEALTRACRAYERGTTETEPVDWYSDFARSVYPGAGHLRQARALRRRQRLGPRYARLAPPFVAEAIGRRLAEEWDYARWVRVGV